jgi:hypothetical protein
LNDSDEASLRSEDSSDSENEYSKYITIDGEELERTFIIKENSDPRIWLEEGGKIESDEYVADKI